MPLTNPEARDPLVLIVDDDPTLREIMRLALESSGFRVEDREDGTGAIEAFDALSPDLMLLDVMMPGLDGYAVCRKIRQHPKGKHFPIVMVTGLDDTVSIDQAYEAGATDFITKPINVDILGYRVRYILRSSRAEAEAAEAHALLEDAVESIPAEIRLYDAADTLVMVNDRAKRTSALFEQVLVPGARFEDIIRETAKAGLVSDAVGREEQWVQEMRLHHANPSNAFEFERSDGRWLQIHERRTSVGGTVAVGVDISDLKERESALRDALIKTEAADRAKTEFLANTSHELRTPLNAIIGFAEIIKAESFGPVGVPEYREFIGDIVTSGQHLLDIINDILDMSRMEAGTLEVQEETIKVPEILDICVRSATIAAEETGVTLTASIPDDAPRLFADARLVKRMVGHLLSNAVKFTNEGGRVDLSVAWTEERPLTIAVRDTGIGMAPEQIPLVLQPFGQADASLARSYEGTGLGLSLTKSMVELHGGRLDLESESGVGTTATLVFPKERVRKAAARRDSQPKDDVAAGGA